MKTMAFASRNAKEILRDKTSLGFGIGFPVILLLLLSLIGANSRIIKELVLSFAMIIPENSDINDIPNTAIPGVSLSI